MLCWPHVLLWTSNMCQVCLNETSWWDGFGKASIKAIILLHIFSSTKGWVVLEQTRTRCMDFKSLPSSYYCDWSPSIFCYVGERRKHTKWQIRHAFSCTNMPYHKNCPSTCKGSLDEEHSTPRVKRGTLLWLDHGSTL